MPEEMTGRHPAGPVDEHGPLVDERAAPLPALAGVQGRQVQGHAEFAGQFPGLVKGALGRGQPVQVQGEQAGQVQGQISRPRPLAQPVAQAEQQPLCRAWIKTALRRRQIGQVHPAGAGLGLRGGEQIHRGAAVRTEQALVGQAGIIGEQVAGDQVVHPAGAGPADQLGQVQGVVPVEHGFDADAKGPARPFAGRGQRGDGPLHRPHLVARVGPCPAGPVQVVHGQADRVQPGGEQPLGAAPVEEQAV